MNYEQLLSAVERNVKREDLSAQIPGFVAQAEGIMGNSLRIRAMEHLYEPTTAVTSRFVQLPKRFIEMKRFRVQAVGGGYARIQYRPPDILTEISRTGVGLPEYFTVIGKYVELDVDPDSPDYTYTMQYYQRPPALGATADGDDASVVGDANVSDGRIIGNQWLDETPHIYVACATYLCLQFLKRDDWKDWQATYQDYVAEANKANDGSSYVGSQVMVPAYRPA